MFFLSLFPLFLALHSRFLQLLYAILLPWSWFWCVRKLSRTRLLFLCDLFTVAFFFHMLFLWLFLALSRICSLSSHPFCCFYREGYVLGPAPKNTHRESNFEIIPLRLLVCLNVALHLALYWISRFVHASFTTLDVFLVCFFGTRKALEVFGYNVFF